MEQTENPTTQSPIESALAEQNVTAQVIAKLKSDYLGLTINGIDDKEGFEVVEKARKECKAIRILAEKICKSGREEAVKIQKDWIAKEKEVVAQIEEVELSLKAESDRIKEEEKQILFKAAQEAKLPMRKEKLLSIGITVDDSELLKVDDAQFLQLFNEFYEVHLTEKAEKLRKEEEKQKAIIEAERNRKVEIYNERKAALMPYWNFLKSDQISIDFSELSDEDFQIIFKEVYEAKELFDEEQKELEETNKKLAEEYAKKEKELAEQKAKADKELKELEEELAKKKAEELKLKEKAEAEEKAKKEAEKKAAKAPDKEKLQKSINDLIFVIPALKTKEGVEKAELISDKFAGFKKWAEEQINLI